MILNDDWIESRLLEESKMCKKLVSSMKCKKHKLKAHFLYDYDNDFTYAHLTKCCCPDFAKEVSDAIRKANIIDVVEIEDCIYTKTV